MEHVSKTEELLEAAALAHADDPKRAHVIQRARTFKRSWIELAEALVTVRNERAYQKWGFKDFDHYCSKELHIRKSTAEKLCVSFGFLRANAPRLVDERRQAAEGPPDREPPPVPTLQAVDFVARAQERGAADDAVMNEMRTAVFDQGMSAPSLTRKYREVAFPVSREEQQARARLQILAAARRLAALATEPETPLPGDLAERVEEIASEVIDTLDEAEESPAAQAA